MTWGSPQRLSKKHLPSFSMERAAGRFKGSWMHNRKETSKWSACLCLLSLHLRGVGMAPNVHVPSQAQIFALELHSQKMLSVYTQSYSLHLPLISVIFLLLLDFFLLQKRRMQSLADDFHAEDTRLLWLPGVHLPGRRCLGSLSPPPLSPAFALPHLPRPWALSTSLTFSTVNRGHILSYLSPEKIGGMKYTRYRALWLLTSL